MQVNFYWSPNWQNGCVPDGNGYAGPWQLGASGWYLTSNFSTYYSDCGDGGYGGPILSDITSVNAYTNFENDVFCLVMTSGVSGGPVTVAYGPTNIVGASDGTIDGYYAPYIDGPCCLCANLLSPQNYQITRLY